MKASMAPRWVRVAALVVLALGWSPVARAAWGVLVPRLPPRTPPEKTWLKDVPQRPGARTRGKVAVFEFKGDDVYQPVREAVVRLLRQRGFDVTVTLRPGESATEYRDMSHALNMAVYIDGEMQGEGGRQNAKVHLYSGMSGRRMATLGFSGATDKIVDDVERSFWKRVGPAITRACTAVAKPRRAEHEPLRIDASDPVD
jgi:hypothetical protein